tara:strand:- start:247 stop:588 length:342 start_codon:yes stop_codon:yes gene_type:complete
MLEQLTEAHINFLLKEMENFGEESTLYFAQMTYLNRRNKLSIDRFNQYEDIINRAFPNNERFDVFLDSESKNTEKFCFKKEFSNLMLEIKDSELEKQKKPSFFSKIKNFLYSL